METVGLFKQHKSLSKNLSTGQRQRLSIAMALYNDPSLLILDEPLNGLDSIIKFIYSGFVLFLIQYSLNHLTKSVVIPLVFVSLAVLGGIESDYFTHHSNGLFPKYFYDFYYCIMSLNPVDAIKYLTIPSIIVLITFICYGKNRCEENIFAIY